MIAARIPKRRRVGVFLWYTAEMMGDGVIPGCVDWPMECDRGLWLMVAFFSLTSTKTRESLGTVWDHRYDLNCMFSS